MTIYRDIQKKYFELMDKNTISVLLGPRRAGKSTLVKEYLSTKENTKKIYLDFDSLTTRDEVNKNGLSYFIHSDSKDKDVIISIDEVQKVPRVLEDIKIIFDRQKLKGEKKYKFVLTGSASTDIHKQVSETLAGRVNILRVYPFSLSEAARLKYEFSTSSLGINKLFSGKSDFREITKHQEEWHISTVLHPFIKVLIQELIEYGALPEVLELDQTEYKQRFLINYKDTYLERDVRTDTSVGNLTSYTNLLTLLGSQSGSLTVKQELKNSVQIAYDTLDYYLSILKATYILFELSPYIFSAKKRLVKSSKYYFFDTGVIALLTGFLSFEQLVSTGLVGNRFECLVINELIKKIKPLQPIADFFFWRSSGGKEVDLIIDFKEKIIPCEIKWTNNIKLVNTDHLIDFLKDYKKAEYGVVIYNGDFYIDKVNKIIYLPFSHLLYY